MALTQVPLGMMTSDAQYTGFKNRIINGAMTIDQRNAGASVSTTSSYPVDRFQVTNTGSSTFTASRSTTTPSNFVNSLNYTVGTGAATGASDQVYFRQIIEGVNGADMGWGTASAQPITISFWVRSSVTGTYGLAVQNYTANRSYVASYVVNSANTWEQKTITITGDTSGTWNTDTANGWLCVLWDLGVGSTFSTTAGSWAGASYRGLTSGVKLAATTGATFYITGVQLEKGSNATAFDYRPYGTELSLCQRYYEATIATTSNGYGVVSAVYNTTSNNWYEWSFQCTKRATPTFVLATGATWSSVPSITTSTTGMWFTYSTGFVGSTTPGLPVLTASAEL